MPVTKQQMSYDFTYMRYLELSDHRTESRLLVARAVGRETGELFFNGSRVWEKTKKFWKWMVAMVV